MGEMERVIGVRSKDHMRFQKHWIPEQVEDDRKGEADSARRSEWE